MRLSIAATAPKLPATSHRQLRIGIIQGSRIVEERILRTPKTVTIGSSPASTFITPSDGQPRQWRLFEQRRGRVILRLGPRMTARIADGATVSAFDTSAESEAVRPIVLPERARGRVLLGETTVLFQLVRPHAPQPRPQLPVSVRRHVISEVDGLFAAILAGCLLLNIAMVVYLRQVDWPRHPAIEELPDRFVHQMLRRPPPAPRQPAAPAKSAPTEGGRKPPAVPASRAAVPTPAKPAVTSAERRAILDKQVHELGLLKVIGALGNGGSARADLLAAGGVDRPVEEALKGISGVTVAADESLRNLPRIADGSGKVATPTGLRGVPGISVATVTGPVSERGVKSHVRVDAPAIEGGQVDPEVIARDVRARRRAVAACYERALKQQPALAGKLLVRFALSTAGAVTAVEIDEDTLGAPDVASCIRALILRWRFPPLAGGPAELSFPFVFQSGD